MTGKRPLYFFVTSPLPEPLLIGKRSARVIGSSLMKRHCASLLLLCATWLVAPGPVWAVTIDSVPVGNAGNGGELSGSGAGAGGLGPDAIVGAVSYDYRIGSYEVTNAQYVEFLNAKAGFDRVGLYNGNMSTNFGGIMRGGSSPNWTYATINGRGDKPVNFVSWYDAIRFANWLHNGQGSGDTETGAYTLGPLGTFGAIPVTPPLTHNAGSQFWLPTENEWYKAAYHQNDGVTSNYFDYPTSSDAVPTSEAPPGGSNSANHSFLGPHLTNVGAYTGTTSPYGAFDLGGNVYEWNEALIGGSFRGLRGGSFSLSEGNLRSSSRYSLNPSAESSNYGFRVATVVPEPSTAVLLIVAGGLMWVLRKRCN
jgi:formylglycine-generating enzyme required for sulfatase activity